MGERAEELSEVVEQARTRLREGTTPTEKAVEYAVVVPILRVLGWDPQNIQEMYPEYGVESKRVDWAFLKDGNPCLFLEEKAPDQKLSAHEEQLLEYAFKQGIRLAVLTNGSEWWFYLPLEEGPWGERKFLVLDLMGPDIEEVCLQLTQFLQKDFVYGELAYKDAKQRYDEARERDRIRQKLPEAIRYILSSPSDRVIEFFQSQTQPQIGAIPPADLVEQALKTVLTVTPPTPDSAPAGRPPSGVRKVTGLELPPPYMRPVYFAIQDEVIPVSYWNQVLIETANWLIRQEYELPVDKGPGRKRHLISRSSAGFMSAKKLINGLYIESHGEARTCVKKARWLMQQAGLSEEDLQVQWEERSR